MKKVIVKRYQLDHVFAHNKILFNTNNHYTEEGIEQPTDYKEKLNQGSTQNWIDKFHENNYYKITLDEHDLNWMRKAFICGSMTGRFSHIYDDELEEICKKYKMPDDTNTGYFIRTDAVSLKEGMYGCGPYDSIEKIIKSMVTCKEGHSCFRFDDTSCNIYFMKWIDINPDKEFRIFVHQNDITAISAQHLYTVNNWLNILTDSDIEKIIHKILIFFDQNIKDKMIYMTDYVMDLALVGSDDETPYFIEPNSFGKYYASGSALFHWIYDHDALHDHEQIEFRYVNEY